MAGVLAATGVRLRYPSPSTCGAAGRHADHLPDGNPRRRHAMGAQLRALRAPEGAVRADALRSSDGCCFRAPPPSPYFDGHRRESRFAAKY